MCWQDVQISRQTVRQSRGTGSGGASLTGGFGPENRRVRVVFTSTPPEAGATAGYVEIRTGSSVVGEGTVIVTQGLSTPLVFDISTYGDDVRQSFNFTIVSDGALSIGSFAEYLLYDPMSLGNPITQTGGR